MTGGVSDAGTIVVEAIYRNARTGEERQVHSSTEMLRVMVMNKDAAIADVELGLGATWKAGDYQSVRIDARVRLPTYVEEVPDAYARAQQLVVEQLQAVHAKVSSGEIALPGINAPYRK